MVSGPRAEKGEYFVRRAEISSAVGEEQSAKGRRLESRGQEGCGGKNCLSRPSFIWVGVVASGIEGKRGESLPKDSYLSVHIEREVVKAKRVVK